MRSLRVTVKPNSRSVGVEELSEDQWVVRVREPATEGKANRAVVLAVARHLGVPPSSVTIHRGEKGKEKLLRII
ncbi:MAG: DUF167 domain-containing protein [Leptospiraceae bacterium]|nr:DUF167 domain-containing protein [Leptospiraceae bacterium]MCB1305162.1 DUF167 domain-containing protein [Leptospiraceae bacterium]